METNFIDVTTPDGIVKAEVLDIFSIPEYEDREYILYSLGEEVEHDSEKIYVSRLLEDNGVFTFEDIIDPKEKELIDLAVDEIIGDAENE